MSRPANVTVPDFNGIFDLPTQAAVATDSGEQNTYRLSASKQWEGQLDYLQDRIEYWQHFLPNGTPIGQLSVKERETAWAIADNVIREINRWVSNVQAVSEGVQDATE